MDSPTRPQVILPILARAQRATKLVIGFLRAGPPPKRWFDAFQEGLRERGYVDGQNVAVELRFTDGAHHRAHWPLATARAVTSSTIL